MYVLFVDLQVIQEMEKKLIFVYYDQFGYFIFCFINLGIICWVSVYIKIFKLVVEFDFKEFCDKFNF